MGILDRFENFLDETLRDARTVVVPPASDVSEVELPEEWKKMTSEDLRRAMRLKMGNQATNSVRASGYEGEVDEVDD